MLGPVQGLIGARKERCRIIVVPALGQPDADRATDFDAFGNFNSQRFRLCADALGNDHRRGGIGLRQDRDEFLAADACAKVALAQGLANRRGELDQHAVACRVSELVVDRLESIQVKGQQCQGSVMSLGIRNFRIQAFHAAAPIGKLGQTIVGGIVACVEQFAQQA